MASLVDRRESPPPSPNPSDTLSLPDVISDLENLSDYSGLSISDEEDKVSHVHTDSDHDGTSDDEAEVITRSMVSSYLSSSHHHANHAAARRDKGTSTDNDYVEISCVHDSPHSSSRQLHTPSPSISRMSSFQFRFPQLPAEETDETPADSPEAEAEAETLVAASQFSFINLKSPEEANNQIAPVQKDPEEGEMDSSAATILQQSTHGMSTPMANSMTSSRRPRSERFPSFAGSWPSDSSDDDHNEENDPSPAAVQAEMPQPASQAQRLPKWRNMQTLGVFGVVLLSMVAYHQKAPVWPVTSTNPYNTSSVGSRLGQPAIDAVKVALESFSTLSPAHTPSMLPAAQPFGDASTSKALMYIPGSDDAAMAESSGSSTLPAVIHVEQRVEGNPDADSCTEGPSQHPVRTNGAVASSLSALTQYKGVTALATLPRRAKKGLSILTAKSVCRNCHQGQRKLKSRRKVLPGSHADIQRSRESRRRSVISDSAGSPQLASEGISIQSDAIKVPGQVEFAHHQRRSVLPNVDQEQKPSALPPIPTTHPVPEEHLVLSNWNLYPTTTPRDLLASSRASADQIIALVDAYLDRFLRPAIAAIFDFDYREAWLEGKQIAAMYCETVVPSMKAIETSIDNGLHVSSLRAETLQNLLSDAEGEVSRTVHKHFSQVQTFSQQALSEMQRALETEWRVGSSALHTARKQLVNGKVAQHSRRYVGRAQRNSRRIITSLHKSVQSRLATMNITPRVVKLRKYLADHSELLI